MKKEKKTCKDCAFLTNVKNADKNIDNVMGGCFFDGHIVTTDRPACKNIVENEDDE